MLRRLIYGLIAVAVAAALVWALLPKPVPVDTAAIGERAIEVTVEEEGVSQIREVYTVSAPIAGQLMRSSLHAGDTVIANQTVVAAIRPVAPGLLDARAIKIAEAAVEAARAAVALAEAQLAQAQSEADFAKSEYERAKLLASKGTIPERSLERAAIDAAIATAAVKSAEASLLVRKRELESAEAALIQSDSDSAGGACCVDVRSPVSGQVLKVATESEQVVQAGTPLVDLGDPADLEIVVDLLSRDAVRVAKGATATIESWGGPPLAATVERIDPAAVTKVSALGIDEQRVKVVLRLAGEPSTWQRLGHDFRVVARIVLWRGEDLVAVPTAALFRTGSDWAVFVVEDGIAHVRPLVLGERNSEYAEVRSGLAAGEEVVLHPSDRVSEGVTVEINAR